MSLRQAWIRGSSCRDGPLKAKLSGTLAVLEEDSALPCRFSARAFLLLDIAFEAVKELLSYAGLRDEHIAPVGFVANAPQIAERAQRIQGARDDGFGYPE